MSLMPEEHYVQPEEDDPPETTVNVVDPDDWHGETPRKIDPDQEPVSRFPGPIDYPFKAGA